MIVLHKTYEFSEDIEAYYNAAGFGPIGKIWNGFIYKDNNDTDEVLINNLSKMFDKHTEAIVWRHVKYQDDRAITIK